MKFRKDYTYVQKYLHLIVQFKFKMATFNFGELCNSSNSTWHVWTHHTYYKHEVTLWIQAVVTSVIPALQSISQIKYKNICP